MIYGLRSTVAVPQYTPNTLRPSNNLVRPPLTDLQNVRCGHRAFQCVSCTTECRVHTGNFAVSDKQGFGLDSHSNVDICSMESWRIVGTLRQVPRVQRFDVSRDGQEHALSTIPCIWISSFASDALLSPTIPLPSWSFQEKNLQFGQYCLQPAS